MYNTGILDVSHWEFDRLKGKITPALKQARDAGIVAVIAKATQGKDYVDPSWKQWASAILDAGLLLGAYHFGSNLSPGDQQSDWFVQAVKSASVDVSKTLLVLDFETNTKPSQTMTTEQARAFLSRLDATFLHPLNERRPMLYSGSSFLIDQVPDKNDMLGAFPLWIAAYGPTKPKIPRAWADWSLFQYTDGPIGPADTAAWPRITPGFGGIDRSACKRTAEQLRAEWPTIA